jgi:hypothetical protein
LLHPWSCGLRLKPMNRFHSLAFDLAWDFGWWRGCYIWERNYIRRHLDSSCCCEADWRGRSDVCLKHVRTALKAIKSRRLRREIGARIAVAIKKGHR